MQPPNSSHQFYTEIMTNYIDLAIIDRKLKQGDYQASVQVIQDIRIVFDKAFRFMKNDAEVYKAARNLSAFFEQKVKDIENVSMKEVLNKGASDPNNVPY